MLSGIQCNLSGERTFTVGNAEVLPFRLVKLQAGGTVAHAAAEDEDVTGCTTEIGGDAGGTVNVKLQNSPGTRLLTAGDVFAAGASLMCASGGKCVAQAGDAAAVVLALTEATADGDVFEGLIIG